MATVYWRGRQAWGRVQRAGQDIRKPLKTTSAAVARRRLKEWVDEVDDVAWGGKPRRTFDDAMLKFMDQHLPTLKPKSQTRYRTSIEALTPHFEGKFLHKITSAALSEYETQRRQAGARIPERLRGKKKPKDISSATIRRDLACLSSMFGCCMEWEWVEFNPVPGYMKARKKRGLRESPPKTRYLSLDEEARLLVEARAQEASGDLHDAICLAIDTGMRKNEQLLLKRPQVNAGRNQIELAQGTKNSKAREIPLLPRSAHLLAQRPAHLNSPYVFTNRETGTHYADLNRGLKGAAKRAGIKALTWHDLRRTCGCRLLQEYRMSMTEVSKWLGHSSVAVTEKSYAFLETEQLHRAIRAGTVAGTGKTD